MSETIEIRECRTDEERQAAFEIRRRVFVREQHVDPSIEWDGRDGDARHFLAWFEGEPAGTARLLIEGETARFGRMAVLPEFRRAGVGRALVKAMTAAARSADAQRITLHAQAAARLFYASFGFREVGEPFSEADILHISMEVDLE